MLRPNKHVFIAFAIAAALLMASSARAQLALSVSPLDGGGDSIRFGRVDDMLHSNQRVRIRITSSGDQRYRVFQRVLDRPVNERGQTASLTAMKTYTLSGSNGSGTLYAQSVETLSTSEQLIYSSSESGASDSFTIVYALDPSEITASGDYQGRIEYIVRPIGSGASQQTQITNITFNVASDFNIKVSTVRKNQQIELIYPTKEGKTSDFVQFEYDNNIKETIKVYQQILAMPETEEAKYLSPNVWQYRAEKTDDRGMQSEFAYVKTDKELIFESAEIAGKNSIEFQLDEEMVKTVRAGIYKGRIRFTVETSTKERTFDFDITITIDPIFEISVKFPDEGMAFENILPNGPPQVKEVGVKVETNLGKPYVIIQNMISPLTNEAGDQIDAEHFTTRQIIIGETKGKVDSGEFKPITREETPVFLSDNNGSPAELKIDFRLKPYPKIQAGNYHTSIVFTLGEK